MDTIWSDILKPHKPELETLAFGNLFRSYQKSWGNEMFKPSPLFEFFKRKSIMGKIDRKEIVDGKEVKFIESILQKNNHQYGGEV